jgi:hypothetical protein
VIKKGTEPLEKSAISSFAFMTIKADGKILLDVFGVSSGGDFFKESFF